MNIFAFRIFNQEQYDLMLKWRKNVAVAVVSVYEDTFCISFHDESYFWSTSEESTMFFEWFSPEKLCFIESMLTLLGFNWNQHVEKEHHYYDIWRKIEK